MNDEMKLLLEDEEFMKAFINAENPEELKKILDEKEIKLDGLTYEEALQIIKKQENGELGEEDLGDVNGGIAVSLALSSAALLAMGAGQIAFYASYGYHKYKK